MLTFRQMLVMAVLSTLIMGCGGAGGTPYAGTPPVPAKGKVTYKNLPVEGATVSFLGDGKIRAAMAVTDSAGDFILTTIRSGDGAVPGDHKVTVTKIVEAPGAKASTGAMSMEDAAKAAQAPPAAKPLSMLPDKYGSSSSSPLSYTVKAGGPNDFKIELTD